MTTMRARLMTRFWMAGALAVCGVSSAAASSPGQAAADGQRVTARGPSSEKADARGRDGSTPLHWAVHRDDLAAVERLLAAGADARAANKYGVTPLWLACVNANAPVIERLLRAGADPNTTMA